MKSLPILAACLVSPAAFFCSDAAAGSFVRGSGAVDRVTHVKGYPTTANPIGGNYVITVCLDPATTPVDAEQATRNVVAEYNRMQGSTNNVVAGNNLVDFESMLLHEVGHCVGMDHNTLGPSEIFTTGACDFDGGTPLPDCGSMPQLYFTNALPDATPPPGPGDVYDADDGADNVRASRDDVRGNDVNRHWYQPLLNNPFAIPPAIVDQTTYSVNAALRPVGHNFIEAATSQSPCNPAATADTSLLRGAGRTANTMSPVICTANFLRKISYDDEATLRIAMAGYDGSAAAATDNYTWQLQYVGRTSTCDIPIRFAPGGFAQCITGLFGGQTGDAVISSGEIIANSNVAWFYNTMDTTGTPTGECIFKHGFEIAASGCN